MDKKVASIRELSAKNDENEKGLQRAEAEQVQRAADENERKNYWFSYKRNLSCKGRIKKKSVNENCNIKRRY